MKRFEALALIVFPLVAFIVILVLLHEATSDLNNAWSNQ